MAEPTAADLRQYLDQLPAVGVDLEVDALITKVLARARAMADAVVRAKVGKRWTGWGAYVPAERAAYGWGTCELHIGPHLVGSVTQVRCGGATVLGATYTEDPYSGNLVKVDGTSWYSFPYAVTASWGFGPMPEEVAEVVLELAINIYRGRDRGMWTDTINAVGGASIKFTGGLTNQQQMILDAVAERYKPDKPTAGTLATPAHPDVYRLPCL